MASTITPPREAQDIPFEAVAVRVLRELRSTVGAVIGHLPQAGQIRKPADLQRELDIDSKLAWQVHRLAFTVNPLADGAGIPKVPAMKRFLKAAREHGVGEEVIGAAQAVLNKLDELIAVHAGDFATFESMLAGLSDHGSEQVDLAHRRAAFRAQSHLWGAQVKTQLWCSLYHPGSSPVLIDSASIRGLRDIRRLRAGAPFRLTGHRLTDAHQHVTTLHALSSESLGLPSATGPNLLHEFCTPLPPGAELTNRVSEGYVDTYLEGTPLGNAGVQTLYLADVTRGIEWCTPGEANHLNNNVANTKPAGALVLDTLVHRGMFGSLAPQVRVNGSLDRLGETDPDRFRRDEELPMHAEVENLGVGLAVLPTPHVPRYAEMVESVCRRVGWDPEGFEAFRCIIEYPVLGSVVSVRFTLPERGNWEPTRRDSAHSFERRIRETGA